jgi:UDP-N-acetylglucosamine acyltransferase
MSAERPRIHFTAVVAPHVEIADDVEIGPHCVVEPGVRIGQGTKLLSHVVVTGRTTIGARNVLHPFCVIGGAPQIKKHERVPTALSATPPRHALVIGDDNVFREHVTVNVSSWTDTTTIGSKNLFMAGCHVAHDVAVGSHCVVANAVQLAGHVVVEDWVTFGGLSAVAQHVRVAESAFVAGGAMCERNVPPFVIVQGDRARVRALNLVGLERRGIPTESIAALRRAFARLYGQRTVDSARVTFDEALAALDVSDPCVAALARALAPGRR